MNRGRRILFSVLPRFGSWQADRSSTLAVLAGIALALALVWQTHRVRALERSFALHRERAERLQARLAAQPALAPASGDRPRNATTRAGAALAMNSAPAAPAPRESASSTPPDRYYAALFEALALPPAGAAELSALLAEKQRTLADVRAAALTAELDLNSDPARLRRLLQLTTSDIENRIHTLLGDEGYARYRRHLDTLPLREVMNELRRSLRHTGAAVTDDQIDRLTERVRLALEAP